MKERRVDGWGVQTEEGHLCELCIVKKKKKKKKRGSVCRGEIRRKEKFVGKGRWVLEKESRKNISV